jgi:hypothetical protein
VQIEFDQYSLTIDGTRRLVRSGALHYFRLPSPALWRTRLEKMREAGLNAVDVYYPWSYHSSAPGEYDFAGFRDVERLHDLIEEAGLWLIARPGPYICAELDFGGLPAWLLNVPGVIPRCREATGFNYSRAFMAATREWFRQVVPRFARRSNLLLVQIENEYTVPQPLRRLQGDLADLVIRWFGSRRALRWFGSRRARRLLFGGGGSEIRESRLRGQRNPYMQELYQHVRDFGVTVPIFHNDLRADVGRQMDVDMLALDRYPLTDLDRDWRDDPGAFAAFSGDEHLHDAHRRGGPVFYAELQGGWYDGWGGTGYGHIRSLLGPDGIDNATKSALAERATLWTYYMFSGGVSWGYMSSPDVYSSYDYGAPVTESGRTGPRFESVRRLNGFLERHEADLAETDRVEDRATWCAGHLCTRQGRTRRFEFLRNPSTAPRTLPMPEAERSELAPWETQVRVYGPDRKLVEVSPPPVPWVSPPAPAPPPLPRLAHWRFSGASPQLDPAYDDSSWTEIDPRRIEQRRIDIDSLGVHYGFVWYRGLFQGPLDRLSLDARHCWAVWINRSLVAAGDQFQNPLGVGPDGARRRRISLRDVAWNEGRNVIVVLVESLGHNKGFADDGRLPRGIVAIDAGATPIQWRFRSGLVRGELGMNPLVAFEGVERTAGEEEVTLPHAWSAEPHGVGLYETSFTLDGIDPKETGLGVSLDGGSGKTNLYLNGYLIGRYWPEMGPQRQFLLPWGLLHPDEENHLAIAVWKRSTRGELGKVRLQVL